MSKYKFKGSNSNNKCVVDRWQRALNPRVDSDDSVPAESSDPFEPVSQSVDWDATTLLNDNNFKLNKKKLYPEEIAKFKQMGEPDLSQNYLELFLPEIVDDLFAAMNFKSNNYEKANYILEELKPYGFYEIGEGTNILVVGNPQYPGVVFKIALDYCGIADNFNDEILQRAIPHYTRVFARHTTGIVSVQEYSVTMNKERMKDFAPRIMRLLEHLSKTYLIADLSPSRFLNFGVNRQGDFVIQDGSDLFPIEQLKTKIRCKYPVGWDAKKKKMIICGGKLEYSPDFLLLRCKECGHEINPLELRPTTKEVDAEMALNMSDGLTVEERAQMIHDEIETIRRKTHQDDPDNVQVVRREAVEKVEEAPAEPEEVAEDVDIHPEPTTENKIFVDQVEEPDDEEEERDLPEEIPIIQSEETRTVDKSMEIGGTLKAPWEDLKKEVGSSLAEKLKTLSQAPEEDKPHIEYKIVDEDSVSGEMSGIYMKVHGEFRDAWDTNGLPIFVSLDDGNTYELALNSTTFMELLDKIIEQIKMDLDDDE